MKNKDVKIGIGDIVLEDLLNEVGIRIQPQLFDDKIVALTWNKTGAVIGTAKMLLRETYKIQEIDWSKTNEEVN